MTWYGEKIYLRQVIFDDLQVLLNWENDPENWEVSDTKTPFSEEEMIDFIVEQADFKSTGQLRLMICLLKNEKPVGAVDLFDIDEKKRSANVGILINCAEDRKKGYATEAIELLKTIAINFLSLQQLKCTIHTTNIASKQLFEKCGFRSIKTQNGGIDEYICSLSLLSYEQN